MKYSYGLLILVILLDRISKQLIVTFQPSNLFGGFVVSAINPDQAFSLSWSPYLVWPLTALLIVYCSWQAWSLALLDRKEYMPWAFIVIGAMSNIVDRLLYGGVIDFVNLKLWPVFNLADCTIVIGVIWLLVREFKIKKVI